jgi:cysteinyl-tRNA synthetase
MQAASNRLQDLRAMSALRFQALPTTNDTTTFALEDVPVELANVLSKDIDTPGALAFLSHVSTQLLSVLIEKDMLDHLERMLKGIDDLLGLNLLSVSDITEAQKQLINERQLARVAGDWAKSDAIRDQLAEQNIGLRDMPSGSIWFPLH